MKLELERNDEFIFSWLMLFRWIYRCGLRLFISRAHELHTQSYEVVVLLFFSKMRQFLSIARRSAVINSNMPLRQFASAAELTVRHDAKKNVFYIPLDDNSKVKAVLEYSFVGDSHVDMYHTGVPEELRGRGIAKQLAIAAFDFAVDQKWTVTPSCSYLQKFVQETENQDYKDRVA